MKRLTFLLFTCFLCGILYPQNSLDSLQLLNEVVVTAQAAPVAYRATAVVQRLSATDWQKTAALQVADAVKHFSGAQIKDYGGIGGLKTVSVRSLSAHYTAVVYDGIAISDYQTGQVDVGRFSLANLGEIRLAIGESDEIFQPARNQALGATLFLQSSSPFGKVLGIETNVRTGSFGLINQSARLTKSFGQRYVFDISGEYLYSDGDYPFTEVYGTTGKSAHKRRVNSDVDNKRAEANFYANLPNNAKFRLKAYAYRAERGIPGSKIYYVDYSAERMADRNLFTQAHYEQSLGNRWKVQSFVKVGDTQMSLKTSKNPNDDYTQQEYFGSVGLRFQATDRWSFAWVNDALRGTFSAKFGSVNSNNVDHAERNTWLSALGAVYETRRITATGRLLSQFADNVSERRHLSPYVGISVQPAYSLPLRFRAFYKNSFRQPTFGDIYFSPFPNVNLRAENAHQYNAGLSYFWQKNANKPSFSFSADAYYNKVENKIVAGPRGSMAVWTVQNYGAVAIRGIDLSGQFRLPFAADYSLSLMANYTYQLVKDRTEGSARYGAHLPYTPKHVGSSIAQISLPYFDVAYSLHYSDARYSNQSTLHSAYLPAFADQNLTVSRTLEFQQQKIRLSAECVNLFDTQYEIVMDYPMPGRSFRVTFSYIY